MPTEPSKSKTVNPVVAAMATKPVEVINPIEPIEVIEPVEVIEPIEVNNSDISYPEKSLEYIHEYSGKVGHNPYIYLAKFLDIEVSIFNGIPLTASQLDRVNAIWPVPLV